MKKDLTIKDELTEFLLYTAPNGDIKVEAFLHNENIWLTQKRMAELFRKGRSTITEHLQNIFNTGELDKNSVCRDFRHTGSDGKNYNTKFYNKVTEKSHTNRRKQKHLKSMMNLIKLKLLILILRDGLRDKRKNNFYFL